MVAVALGFDNALPPRHPQGCRRVVILQRSKSQTSDLVGGALVDGDSRVLDGRRLQGALVAVLGVLPVVLLVVLQLLVVLLLLDSVGSGVAD